MRQPRDNFHYSSEAEIEKIQDYLCERDIEWSTLECYVMWESFSDSACAQFLGIEDCMLDLFWEWLNE